MLRVLKAIAAGGNTGDVSTLASPEIVEEVRK